MFRTKNYLDILSTQVDLCERITYALALELGNSLVLLDDSKGRKLAKKIGLIFIGSLGVICKSKKFGIISAIKPLLDKLKATDFRIS
jgi:predicted nucleic acid-binding protein